jgi:hypothetical protein
MLLYADIILFILVDQVVFQDVSTLPFDRVFQVSPEINIYTYT